MYDYKIDKPPTILFRHQDGPIAQSNIGELIVFPGATLHMECLFLKRAGTPTWTTRRTFRNWNNPYEYDKQSCSILSGQLCSKSAWIYGPICPDNGKFKLHVSQKP